MRNPSAQVDLTGIEFLRGYDPSVTLWTLTETGTSRVVSNVFPHGIGVKGPGALRILHKIGAAEEDEIAGFMGLTPSGAKRLMKRLAGHGLVVQAA